MRIFLALFLVCLGLRADEISVRNLSLEDAYTLLIRVNPSLVAQRALNDVAAAQGDQLRAFHTPVIGFGVTFPLSSQNAQTDYDLKIAQNIDGFFSLPARSAAAQKLKEAQLEVSRAQGLRLLRDVNIAFLTYQSAREQHVYLTRYAQAGTAIADLATGQFNAGNISALERDRHLVFQKTAILELVRIENQLMQSRIALGNLIGLPASDKSWDIEAQIPPLPVTDPDSKEALNAALSHPAFNAIKAQIEADSSQASAARAQLWPELSIGLSAGLGSEGNRGIGPFFQIGMPFAPKAQAALRKAEADSRAHRATLASAEYNLKFEIEALVQQMKAARRVAEVIEKEVIPLNADTTMESLRHYNFMLLSSFQLLTAKQNELRALRDAVQARQDYWVARAELEYKTGRLDKILGDLK